MLAVGPADASLCEGISRREWLRVGGLAAAGLTLPELLARQAVAAQPAGAFGRARSCIVAFLFGAPAHQDLWDLKPDAPAEVRGEFRPIETSVPGIRISEHLPRVAKLAHRYAIVRSVSHPDDTHTVAMHAMLTGTRHAEPNTNPQNKPSDFPCFGAAMQYLRPGRGALPSGISLNAPANQVSANNHIFPGFFAGMLGRSYDPLFVEQDPSRPDFRPFQPPAGLSEVRLQRRDSLRASLDRAWAAAEPYVDAALLTRHQRRALELVTSAEARRAFDLSGEASVDRERYGKHPFGQGLLLARRLVEAGVGLVTVNWMRDDAFWDTHADNFNQLRDRLLPPFDLAFSALLDDLARRGMLDETLVVCLGEFGRTPRINPKAGRDHWAACNSVVLAGGGIRGGVVYGASDATAAYPTADLVTPADLAATIYHALGIDPRTELRDPQSQPRPLTTGEPILRLFG